MKTKTKSISKHTPQRTCVACRTVSDKRELVRLVRVEDGIAEIDDSGRKNGRGAYLCRRQKCWQEGLKGGRLERALRTTLKPENKKRLVEYGSSIQGD
ncbi:MAG TPA: YlxR family protein [Dehalococcoidia bacterium]|nr:YlxR family protein [Dehalococcoidia bacterium]